MNRATPKRIHVRGGVVLGLLLCAGCTTFLRSHDAFNPMFPDNKREPTRRVVQRLPSPGALQGPTNATGKPVAVGTSRSTEDRELVAFDVIDGAVLWTQPFDAMTRPEVRGDVVISSTREDVVAFDLRSGQELWREELDELDYVGSDRQGSVVVYVTGIGAAGGREREGRVIAVDARSGSERWERGVRGILARPAVQGGMVFLPWDRQNIAVLDLREGKEMARLRMTDDYVDWAYGSPAGIYYGSQRIYRLTEKSHAGTKEEAVYRPGLLAEAPGEPLVHDHGFMPTPGTKSARGRIRIYFEPAPPAGEDDIAILGDTFYFAYYRYVFAFDQDENLKWVRNLDQDVLNAQVLEHGLLTVGEEGTARVLDAETGNDRWSSSVEHEFAAVGLDALGFDAGGEPGERRDLRESLNEIALDPDNRLAPARAFAIRNLAEIDDPEVTRDLLDLYAQRSMPSTLRDAIGEALRKRDSGSEHLVEALDQHYDYLESTKAPPLEIIVPALLETKTKEALPGLVSQLNHPATPAEVLPLVIRGIVQLGGEQALEPLRDFLVLYHADSIFAEEPKPLLAAARGIFEQGGPEGRELLKALVGEGTTHDKVAKHIGGMFEAEQREAERRARAKAEEAARQAAEDARRQAQKRPEKLTQGHINQTFAEHADELRECIMTQLAEQPELARVRIAFVVENDGSAHDFRLVPNAEQFVSCLEPTLRGIKFPQFKQRRQRANFSVRVGGQEQEAKQEQGDRPWWHRQQARAPQRARVRGQPWWRGMPRRPQRPARNAQQRPANRPERPAAASSSGEGQPWWVEAHDGEPDAPQGGGHEGEPGESEREAETDEPPQQSEQEQEQEQDPWWEPTQ